MEHLPQEIIDGYLPLSHELFPGSSSNLFAGVADSGNHYREFGIQEGMILVFDREKPYKAGDLSCFMDSSLKLFLRKHKKKGCAYLGKLVGTIAAF